VQLACTFADIEGELADCLAVDACQATGSTDTDAFTQRGDNLDLLVTRKDVHGANPCCCGWP
jgi:hypothetical protein